MKHLLILISILLLSSPVIGQSEKPKAIIIDTGSLGEINKTRIKILDKTLESKLDDYFAIVPKEIFEEAKEEAFQELEDDECTEDQCVMKIQEILQVENAFKMELIDEDGNTQISVTWNNQEEKRVEEDYCEECETKKLRETIGRLVEALMGKKNSAKEDERIAAEQQEIAAQKEADRRYERQKLAEEKRKVDAERRRIAAEQNRKKTTDYSKSQNFGLSNFKIRGLIGSDSTDSNKASSTSLCLVIGKWGLGLSNFSLEHTSSGGLSVESQNQSWDITYDYILGLKTNFILGLGIINSGEAKRPLWGTTSTSVNGYRLMSYLSSTHEYFELLGGYQYSTFTYKKLFSANDYSASGGLFVLGLGKEF